MKQIFLFVLLVSTLVSSGQKQNQKTQDDQYTFIIGSGSRGGNYYKTGGYIETQYNHYFNAGNKNNYTFQNIETNGSIENINLLSDNKIDFAIVQRNVLINNYYDDEKGTKNFQIITPLFQEKLNMYYNGKKDTSIRLFDQIAEKKKKTTKKQRVLKIGFTDKNGYSYEIFHDVLRFLDIQYKNIEEIEDNYNDLIQKFNNKEIDILVSFSLPLKELESKKNIHHLYLQKDDINLVTARIKNVKKTKISNGKYTIGIWSFFIGSNATLFQIKNKKLLIDALSKKDAVLPNDDNNYIRKIISNDNKLFFKDKNNKKLLRNFPLISNLNRKIFTTSNNIKPYLILIAFLLFILLVTNYYFTGRIIPKISLKYIWYRYKHFFIGFLILLVIYFASIEFLLAAERNFYKETGIKSQILNLTYQNLHSWLAVTNLTGNDNGIFPHSLTGKFMVALNTLNFWIGTVLVGASEYINYQLRKKRKLGIMKTKHKNHVVIFGWDNSTDKFVTELIADAKEFYNLRLNLVLVVEDNQKILTKYPRIREMHEQQTIDIIKGDAMDFHVLELAKVHLARVVILLAERNNEHSDKNTVMRAFAISRFCKNKIKEAEKKGKNIFTKANDGITNFSFNNKENSKINPATDNLDAIYMIAELNDSYYKESLIEADVNEILVADNYRKAAIKQSVFNFGMTKVLDELMQYNEGNDFYKIHLKNKNNQFLVGKNYDELLVMLRKVGILLIGIHVIFYEKKDPSKILIDQKKIRERLEEEDHLTRDILINPTDEKERTRKVDDNDHLIVIATTMKVIKEGLKKLREEMDNKLL